LNRLTRKYTAILLIFLIVFNSFGYVVAFFQMQFIFKNLAYEKINSLFSESPFTILRIPLQEITVNSEFIEYDESEISYYGKMYDIFKKEIRNNDIIFYCIGDENEDALNNAFSSFVKQQTNQNSNNPVTNLIKQLIKEASSVIYYNNHNLKLFQRFFSFTKSIYTNIYLDVITPPPELI